MNLVEAEPGQNVYDFAAELLVLAYCRNGAVRGQFNQHVLEARPGMMREQVLKPWDDFQRRSYSE